MSSASAIASIPLRLGFVIRFGAPPDPITSGKRISMYSSCSKGRFRRDLESGSLCSWSRSVSAHVLQSSEQRSHNAVKDSMDPPHMKLHSCHTMVGMTYLDVCSPGILARRDRLVVGIVQELGILAQASPQTKLLASVVTLVDQVALVGIGAVTVGKGLAGAVPGLRLEAVVVLEAHLDALAERPEEGGLVGGGPAEAGPFAVGRGVVASRGGGRVGEGLEALGRVVVVVRHGHDQGGGRGRRRGRRRGVDRTRKAVDGDPGGGLSLLWVPMRLYPLGRPNHKGGERGSGRTVDVGGPAQCNGWGEGQRTLRWSIPFLLDRCP